MQELVVESLVVSLAMVVFYVLVDETTQMPLAERDHACETLLFDRPDEPLGIGVEIGTLRRQPNRLNGIVRLTLRPAQCRDEHSPAPLPSASLSARNHQPCRLALPQILHELPGC